MQKVARVKQTRKKKGKGQGKVLNGLWQKIAIFCKYGECHDSEENSDFLLLRQRDPFVWCAMFYVQHCIRIYLDLPHEL